MASGRLLLPGWMPALDGDGSPIPNVRAYFYVDGTTTLASVFADEGLGIPLANPVEANSSGRFPAIWASDAAVYTWSVEAPYGPAGMPFTGTGLEVSQGTAILVAAAAEAAVTDAEAAAFTAASAAAASAQDLADIQALAAAAPDTDPVAIAGRLRVNGSNIGANGPTLLGNIGAVSLSALALGSGASLIGTIADGAGAIAQSLAELISQRPISVIGYIPVNLRAAVLNGTSTADVTTYVQAALTANKAVFFPAGLYNLTDKLSLRDDQYVVAAGRGTMIKQTASEKQTFYALSKTGIVIHGNGAILYGKGDWSPSWTNAADHFDRGVNFVNCNEWTIFDLHTRNYAVAGLCLNGGLGGLWVGGSMKGTNSYSTPLPAEANNQMGVYLMAHAPYGAPDLLIISGLDISGTAMGVLCELPSTGTQPTQGTYFGSMNIHDIPGQHAFYCQYPVTIDGVNCSDIYLAAIKHQSTADNAQDLRGFSAKGVVARRCGSSMFEIAQVNGPATIRDVELEGVGYDVGVAISTVGRVSGRAKIMVEDCDSVHIATGDGSNFVIEAKAYGTNNDAIIDTATNSYFKYPDFEALDVRRTAGDANSAAANIASASTVVEFTNPRITAASGGYMKYAFTNKVAGGIVRVMGLPSVTGAATNPLLETAPIQYSGWRSWTPTYSATSGTITTITTNTAKFVYVAPTTIAFDLDVTFTDAGTGGGDFFFTLPVAAANPFAFAGFDQLTTGVNIVCRVRPGDLTKASIVTQTTGASAGAPLTAASTIATGRRIIMSGLFQPA